MTSAEYIQNIILLIKKTIVIPLINITISREMCKHASLQYDQPNQNNLHTAAAEGYLRTSIKIDTNRISIMKMIFATTKNAETLTRTHNYQNWSLQRHNTIKKAEKKYQFMLKSNTAVY